MPMMEIKRVILLDEAVISWWSSLPLLWSCRGANWKISCPRSSFSWHLNRNGYGWGGEWMLTFIYYRGLRGTLFCIVFFIISIFAGPGRSISSTFLVFFLRKFNYKTWLLDIKIHGIIRNCAWSCRRRSTNIFDAAYTTVLIDVGSN